MEEIEKLVAEISIHSIELQSMHWIEVTHIIDPFNFFIRPNKYKPIIEFIKHVEPSTKPIILKIQDLVLYDLGYSCGGRNFIRGRISSIMQISCNSLITVNVFAIDYGFTEKNIPIDYLWECPPDLANTPPLAFNCQLANCYPTDKHFPRATISVFKYYAGFEPIQMKVLAKKPHKLLVALINSFPESVASLLAMKGYSGISRRYDDIAWYPFLGRQRMFFDFKRLTVDDNIRVRVMSGRSLNEFYVAEISDYKKHLKEIDIISFYAKREFPLLPSHLIEGTLVCVKIDDKNIYERAFIKKVTKPSESAIVQLVDWGRDEEFPVGKMKYMFSQCLRTPVLSIYCKADVQNLDSVVDKDLLSTGYEFNIKIKKLGHEFEGPNTVDISLIELVNEERTLSEERYDDGVRGLPAEKYHEARTILEENNNNVANSGPNEHSGDQPKTLPEENIGDEQIDELIESEYEEEIALSEKNEYEEASYSSENYKYEEARTLSEESKHEEEIQLPEDCKYEEARDLPEDCKYDEARALSQESKYDEVRDLLEDYKYDEARALPEDIRYDETKVFREGSLCDETRAS